MSTETDKIRILWIDDDRSSAGSFPEELCQFFEVVHFAKGGVEPFRNADEFAPVLRKFWYQQDRSVLPVEIILMDYNLSQGEAVQEGFSSQDASGLAYSDDDKEALRSEEKHPAGVNISDACHFQGLLIGLFYASLTYEHPCGLVPMTYYGKFMPEEVPTMHKLVEPFLGVDFRDFEITPEERKWRPLIDQGVRQLRGKIAEHYWGGVIDISPRDLMGLIDDPNHEAVTVRSRFCTRRLPTQGLFVDVPQYDRAREITRWASTVFEEIVSRDVFVEAEQLADRVWHAYENDELIVRRWKLSELSAKKTLLKAKLDEDEEGELEALHGFFGVDNTGKGKNLSCLDKCVDIRIGDCNGPVRRWASLLIILRLLHRAVLANRDIAQGPIVTEEDVYLSLFSVPTNPIVNPWHKNVKGGKPDFDSMAWAKHLHGWTDSSYQTPTKKGWGNLGLDIGHVLKGYNWGQTGLNEYTFGLREAERQILRGLAIDMIEDQAEWQDYGPANKVLWGVGQ